MNTTLIEPSKRSAVPPESVKVDGLSSLAIRVRPKIKINDMGYVLTPGGEIMLIAVEGFSYATWLDYDGTYHVLKTQELIKVRYRQSNGVEWIPAHRVFKSRNALIKSLRSKETK